MQEMNFKITKQDIIDYLDQYKENETIKNREAMFVKYMKESHVITREFLEILMKKYNWDDRRIDGTYSIYDGRGYSRQEELSTFTDYLLNIKNLDVSGICHIMIPCIKYYDHSDFRHNVYWNRVNDIAKVLEIEVNAQSDILLDTIDDYTIAGQIADFRNYYRGYSRITMSKDKSRKLIERYSCIYGEEPVKQIRKLIRERA